MTAARLLRYARRRAGLSQRELAERTGRTQSAVSRIESGAVTPRFDTLAELVRSCGKRIDLVPVLGEGVDRTLVRAMRRLPPEQRLRRATMEARNVAALQRATRRA
ncbi:MAG TPA: helix-turn-helix transcriptional regulator [Gemmatimonadota bacterium]|nr:helix-turn-helix transcriptional regulator [Gemmatimonadota bacterium]